MSAAPATPTGPIASPPTATPTTSAQTGSVPMRMLARAADAPHRPELHREGEHRAEQSEKQHVGEGRGIQSRDRDRQEGPDRAEHDAADHELHDDHAERAVAPPAGQVSAGGDVHGAHDRGGDDEHVAGGRQVDAVARDQQRDADDGGHRSDEVRARQPHA
jgi:hypothetical protein